MKLQQRLLIAVGQEEKINPFSKSDLKESFLLLSRSIPWPELIGLFQLARSMAYRILCYSRNEDTSKCLSLEMS